jgi:hypothetical protein
VDVNSLFAEKWKGEKSPAGYVSATPGGRPASEKAPAVLLYALRLSLNRIARMFKVSTPAVLRRVRLFAEKVYEKPKPREAVVVESDEMWRYPRSNNKLWIWKAYCHDTGQLVDCEYHRSHANLTNATTYIIKSLNHCCPVRAVYA